MTRTPFDQFSKQFLEEFLAPLGTVQINYEIPGEPRWVDIWFEPTTPPPLPAASLGLLGRIAATPCLIEPYRKQPTVIETFSCKLKLFSVFAVLQRQAEQQKRRIPDSLAGFPWLWILAPAASKNLIQHLKVIPDVHWGKGIYFDVANRTALIAINQLPITEDTLWIRLLGKGKVQHQAIDTILDFAVEDPHRLSVLQLLVTWKISLEITEAVEQEDRKLMATLSKAYQEWEQRTTQRGIQQGLERGLEQGLEQGAAREVRFILRLLTRRLNHMPTPAIQRIEQLSLEQLEALGEALLDFSGIDALEAWLRDHEPER